MITFFPKQLSHRAVALYLGILLGLSVVFLPFAIKPLYMLLGVACVAGFFYLSYYFSLRWREIASPAYVAILFGIAFLVRIVCMTALYFYFNAATGIPFEFQTVDALGYHLDAEWMATVSIPSAHSYVFDIRRSFSDSGYLIYLSMLYRIIGPSIYLARVVKCILGAWSCVLVYRMASRHMDESTGRIAALFCCFMPNLIFYCGLHLKEVEMIFLTIAALERLTYVMHKERVDFLNSALVALLIFLVFTFRTVLGLSLLFAVATTAAFVTIRRHNRWQHITIIVWAILALGILAGGAIANDVSTAWENRVENQVAKRGQQSQRGNLWAKYATGGVMAPMMFVIPFPTMVDVDQQYTQQMLHGGNYVRNFLGIFVLIAVVDGLFFRRERRRYVLILSFVVSYLGVVCLSGFANSERFVLPALPFLLLLAADGVTHLTEKSYRWVRIWYWIVPLMPLGWAIFKLGSRGLL